MQVGQSSEMLNRLYLGDETAFVSQDAAANMLFTDGVTGAVTLAALLGGATLQTSYNGGSAITTTVAGGAATINHGSAIGVSALVVSDASAALASTAPLVEIDNAAASIRTTGDLFSVDQNADAFIGSAIDVNLAGNSVGQQALTIADDGTGVNVAALVSLVGTNNARTAAALRIALTGAANLANFLEMAAGDGAAVSAANEGRFRYDVATQTFQVSQNTGAWTTLAVGAGNSLQAAYVAGNAITTTTLVGQVTFSGTQANNDDVLAVDKSPAAPQAGSALQISMAANATGNGVNIDMTGGSGDGLNVEITAANADAGVQGIVAVDNGTGVNVAALCEVTNANAARTTGPLLSLVNAQNAFSGDAINVAFTGNSTLQQAIVVTDAGGGNNTTALVSVASTNATRTGGSLVGISNSGVAYLGDLLNVTLTGNSVGQRGALVVDQGAGANLQPIVLVVNQNDVRTSGDVLQVSNVGDLFTGSVVDVFLGAASNATAAQGLTVLDGSTGINTVDLVAITSTNDSRTSGDLFSVSNAGDGLTGALVNAEITAACATVGATMALFTDNGTANNLDPMVHISNQNDSRGSGPLLQINQDGAAFAGETVSIVMTGNSVGQSGIVAYDNGAGINTAPVVSITGSNNARTGAALRIGMLGAALLTNFVEFAPGDNCAVSAANEGRLRYEAAGDTFQLSGNGVAWSSIGTLDNAYDFGAAGGSGATIIADSGPVLITTGTTGGLHVSSTTNGQYGVQITSATTANPLSIVNTGASAQGCINVTSTLDTPLLRMIATISAAAVATLIDVQMNEAASNNFSGTVAQFASGDGATGMDTLVAVETMTSNENLTGNVLRVDGSASTARGTTANAAAGVVRILTQGNKPAAGAGASPYTNAPLVVTNATAGQQSWIVLKDTANIFWRLYVSPAGVVTTELC